MRFTTPIKKFIYLLQDWLKLREIQYFFISVIVLVTLVCILQPEWPLLKMVSMQTVLILLAWLTAGVVFLMLRSTRLAFVSLFSCALLCLFLKNASNVSLAGPRPLLDDDVKFTVGHFNLSYIQDDLEECLELIKGYERDILIFQEYTPDFRDEIRSFFDTLYSDCMEYMRTDDYGQIIFSKFPLTERDTIEIYGFPFLKIRANINNGSPLHVVSQYSHPPITDSLKQENRRILDRLSDYVSNIPEPLIVAGTFNYVSWDNEMVRFRYESNLHDSRKYYFPSITQGSKSIFSTPIEHIFYNDYLECIQFKNIEDDKNTRIGIRARFQINPNEKIFTSTLEEH